MRHKRVLLQRFPAAATAAAVLALWAGPAAATVRIQRDAVEITYPAANCAYCHVFDSDHMMQKTEVAGVKVQKLDCYACHRGRLPKTGDALLNDRGLYLVRARRHLKVDKVDAHWLAQYHEPSPAPPRK